MTAGSLRAGTLRHRILVFLQAQSAYSWNPKQIAMSAKANHPSVKKELRRMVARGEIANPAYGLYQHPEGLTRPSIDPRIRWHGLKFEARATLGREGLYRRLYGLVTTRFMDPSLHRRNRTLTTRGDWNLRPLTITLHPPNVEPPPNGLPALLLEVWMNASALPLHLLELFAYMESLVFLFDLPGELWYLRQADWNIDIAGVQLSKSMDLTSVSVAEGKRRILKMYEKASDLLRVELRDFEARPMPQLLKWAEAILAAMGSAEDREGGPK